MEQQASQASNVRVIPTRLAVDFHEMRSGLLEGLETRFAGMEVTYENLELMEGFIRSFVREHLDRGMVYPYEPKAIF